MLIWDLVEQLIVKPGAKTGGQSLVGGGVVWGSAGTNGV